MQSEEQEETTLTAYTNSEKGANAYNKDQLISCRVSSHAFSENKKKITNLCKAVAQRCIFFLLGRDTHIEQKKNCTVQDRTDAKNSPIIQSQVYKQHGEVMAVAMITLKERGKKCVCVCVSH